MHNRKLIVDCMALTLAEFTARPRSAEEMETFARIKAQLDRLYPWPVVSTGAVDG